MADISETEEIIRKCANKVCGTGKISYQGEEIDLEKPFRRITMIDSIIIGDHYHLSMKENSNAKLLNRMSI